jgi:pyruvate/2-oxoglutarate dehydrogenase complex dihydrolipoamide acyltransferase (E2) component
MKGKPIGLSRPRRFVCDLLEAAASVPSIPVQRRISLGPLPPLRAADPARPPWTALFTRAFALVAREIPELRRAYVKIPWGHLYEYPGSVASIAIEKEYRGERGVFIGRIREPERMSVAEVARAIRRLQTSPIEEVKEFSRAMWVSGLPWAARRLAWWIGLNWGRKRARLFGTFAVSVYSALGAESLHPISPLNTLNYGVIADGAVDVRLTYDHRAMDGSTVARALTRLEEVLLTDIVAEMRQAASRAA